LLKGICNLLGTSNASSFSSQQVFIRFFRVYQTKKDSENLEFISPDPGAISYYELMDSIFIDFIELIVESSSSVFISSLLNYRRTQSISQMTSAPLVPAHSQPQQQLNMILPILTTFHLLLSSRIFDGLMSSEHDHSFRLFQTTKTILNAYSTNFHVLRMAVKVFVFSFVFFESSH
jgi:hypothetical protein